MNELEKLIKKLIQEKGGSRSDYLKLLNDVGYHESAHTMDPTIKQIGGGPGRGIYQFEEGNNRGGAIATRRAKMIYDSLYKTPAPKWIQDAAKQKSVDASKFSKEQQDFLFLANMRMHPKANFSDIWEGKKTTENFWADYHWAGSAKDRGKRIKSFKNSTSLRKEDERGQLVKDIDAGKFDKQLKMSKNKTALSSFLAPKSERKVETQQPSPSSLLFGNNKKAQGGSLNYGMNNSVFNAYNTGGTHEQNSYGGIPQGMGSNGKMNTVEEGEASFNFEDGKYIFSNRF